MVDDSFTDEAPVSVDPNAAEMEKEWFDTYGFTHKCHCRRDWDEGNTVEVAECFYQMTLDALSALATIKAEMDNTLPALREGALL